MKNCWVSPTISNIFDICKLQIVGLNLKKTAYFSYIIDGVGGLVTPNNFSMVSQRFLNGFSIACSLWKSVRFVVWCELGLKAGSHRKDYERIKRKDRPKTGEYYEILGQTFSNSFKKQDFQTILERYYLRFIIFPCL